MENIKIGEREYVLKLNVGACKRVEKALGKSVFEALGTKADGSAGIPSLEDIITLFWGAMLINDPNLSIDEAEKLLDAYFDGPDNDLRGLIDIIAKSINFIKAPLAQ